MGITEVVIRVLPLLIAIVLGNLLFRYGFLTEKMIGSFKKMVVNVTLPAGLLAAFSFIHFKSTYVIVIAVVFMACFLMYYIAILLAKLFSIKSKYFPFLLTGFEAGMMGYALYGSIYGMDKISNFGIIDVGQVLFVFLVLVPAIISLNKKENSQNKIVTSMKIAIKSPVIWAIFIGLILSVSGLYRFENTLVIDSFKNILEFISAPTSLLICLVIGSGLQISLKKVKFELLTAVLKILLAISMALLIRLFVLPQLGLTTQLARPLFSMFVLPAPFVIPVFMGDGQKEELHYVSNTLSIGTALGLVLFILIAFISV